MSWQSPQSIDHMTTTHKGRRASIVPTHILPLAWEASTTAPPPTPASSCPSDSAHASTHPHVPPFLSPAVRCVIDAMGSDTLPCNERSTASEAPLTTPTRRLPLPPFIPNTQYPIRTTRQRLGRPSVSLPPVSLVSPSASVPGDESAILPTQNAPRTPNKLSPITSGRRRRWPLRIQMGARHSDYIGVIDRARARAESYVRLRWISDGDGLVWYGERRVLKDRRMKESLVRSGPNSERGSMRAPVSEADVPC
ncbi:hypothetical protein BDN71DRAFT_1433866 [Pleurotus eryngii]|uniref:Uncharacterized protein n=1 Tax=Pleurotus eryngii TaxID=5323 RepID=A0A9P6DDM9_PLEER|nr:hypothetical protein BDN71DRAFT_1433866 [Pleurotus eryngii]